MDENQIYVDREDNIFSRYSKIGLKIFNSKILPHVETVINSKSNLDIWVVLSH